MTEETKDKLSNFCVIFLPLICFGLICIFILGPAIEKERQKMSRIEWVVIDKQHYKNRPLFLRSRYRIIFKNMVTGKIRDLGADTDSWYTIAMGDKMSENEINKRDSL